MIDTSELSYRPTPADVTVAICTIGREGYLQAAIRSLLETTPPGVRLHVMFNGAEQVGLISEVRQLSEQWDGPAEVTTLSERVGIADSHNTALNACSTEFITFMGDDDIVLEPRIDRLLDIFWHTTPTPLVVGSFCRRVSGRDDHDRFSSNKDYGPTTVEAWQIERDSGGLIEIVFPSALYRTEPLRAIGGFEARFGSAMDLATFTRLGQVAPVLADVRRSFAHRIHDGSVTTSQAPQHARRLRYTQVCMSAIRAGKPEPSWDDFIRADDEKAWPSRWRESRQTLSAALFRQGGAALASGNVSRGAIKAGAAAALSPTTFAVRSRAQQNRPAITEPVVTILMKNCNQYRLGFYSELRKVLAEKHIELRLVVGDGLPEDNAKGDRGYLPWAETRAAHVRNVAGQSIVWQPGFDIAISSDLVIVEQASKQLFNVLLAFTQRAFRTKMAFWGHGRNFQESIESGSGEGLKRALIGRAHWFFAYNHTSADAAVAAGYPSARITRVMNSTDTRHIREVRAALAHDAPQNVRAELGIGAGPVALYLGGVYRHKRPEFLVEAAIAIREKIPDFEMLVIGSGSMVDVLDGAAERFSWFHSIGAIYGDERIRLASVCELQLMPGLVGLNVVDAFALGLPTVTTEVDYHSPEIEYLRTGENGLITPAASTAESYGTAVADLLLDSERLSAMQVEADLAGQELSVERMAANFADGVEYALKATQADSR